MELNVWKNRVDTTVPYKNNNRERVYNHTDTYRRSDKKSTVQYSNRTTVYKYTVL